MLSIYAATKFHDQIHAIIQQEDRLDELVRVIDYLDERPLPAAHSLVVKKGEIWPAIDWYNVQPPYLLPESIPLTAPHLLGLLFAKLNNVEKAIAYLEPVHPTLLLELDFINRLQHGIPIDPNELVSQYSPFEEYRLMHNQAIVRHYAATKETFDLEKVIYFYQEALRSAPTDEYYAFTLRQKSLLLLDTGRGQRAIHLIEKSEERSLSQEARTELRQALCQAWMQQLSVPYDQELLEKLKATLWEVWQAYEKQGRPLEEALLLMDAGTIANYSESWSESLGYFNRALAIFEQEELPELAANAHYRKGTLLFTWAQNGNPQFYRPAAESYQEAIKVFDRHSTPEVFAEIQHHLGIIYSEIPDEVKKKSIWAAVSSSAFQEALAIYQKDRFPYEYAAVCNHYGNALTKYPAAVLSDNYEKALYYYQEALQIRTPDKYPLERCLTILNQLEAQWYVGMPEDEFQRERYLEMVQKATEVLHLSKDEQLKTEAQKHLDQLTRLKEAYVS